MKLHDDHMHKNAANMTPQHTQKNINELKLKSVLQVIC